MTPIDSFVILTAASDKYYDSLYALIQSVRRNWSKDISILVYDLGLTAVSLAKLEMFSGVEVRPIPEFCPHWRKHYSWKLWIIAHCAHDKFLWIDSGVFVLRPLDSIVHAIEDSGLFLVPNYQNLAIEAPPCSVYACGLVYSEIKGRSSVSANIMGGRVSSPKYVVFTEAYRLALNEENVMATTGRHRHDQALISCVLYSKFPYYAFYDGLMYAGWAGPTQVDGQVCWGHRRGLLEYDRSQLRMIEFSAVGGYRPLDPCKHKSLKLKLIQYLKGVLGPYIKKGKQIGLR
jgi:hypothetical protein